MCALAGTTAPSLLLGSFCYHAPCPSLPCLTPPRSSAPAWPCLLQLMLMHILQLWHYPEATLFTEIPHSGIPSWVRLRCAAACVLPCRWALCCPSAAQATIMPRGCLQQL